MEHLQQATSALPDPATVERLAKATETISKVIADNGTIGATVVFAVFTTFMLTSAVIALAIYVVRRQRRHDDENTAHYQWAMQQVEKKGAQEQRLVDVLRGLATSVQELRGQLAAPPVEVRRSDEAPGT